MVKKDVITRYDGAVYTHGVLMRAARVFLEDVHLLQRMYEDRLAESDDEG